MSIADLENLIREITAERELDLQPGALLSPEDSAAIRDEARAHIAAQMKIEGKTTDAIADTLGLSKPSTLRFLGSDPVREQMRLLRQDLRDTRLAKLSTAAETAIASLEDIAATGLSENARVSAAGELRAWIADEAKTDKSEAGSGHSGMGGVQINILNALAEPPKQVQLVDLRAKT